MSHKLPVEFIPVPGEAGMDQVRFLQNELNQNGFNGSAMLRIMSYEDIFEAGIYSVPAIRFNGQLVIEGRNPEPKDIEQWVEDFNRGGLLQVLAAGRRDILPRTLNQALDVINDSMDEEKGKHLAGFVEEDLIQFHMGWGMGIRNSFNLFRNRELLKECGTDCADEASSFIIKKVWESARLKYATLKGNQAEQAIKLAYAKTQEDRLSLDEIVKFVASQPGAVETTDNRPIVMIIRFDDGSGVGVSSEGLDLLELDTPQ